jgi:hypothetical protein
LKNKWEYIRLGGGKQFQVKVGVYGKSLRYEIVKTVHVTTSTGIIGYRVLYGNAI